MNTFESKKNIFKDQTPLFSILIPTRDRPGLTEDLIASILEQNFTDFELIISDNSTNNDTQEVLNKIEDHRVINYRTGNLNMADNWEAGIEKCSGLYLLLFSDKMVLKQNSLEYLADYIKKYSPSCINWNIDSFFDKELTYLKNKSLEKTNILDTSSILKEILNSEFDSVKVPCHCNSAISMSVIKSIKTISGRVCMQLNPDYTLAYQVLLHLDEIHDLGHSLSILRYPSLKIGYGNGTSFMQKGEQAKNFMQDNSDWILRTDKYNDVRMQSNHFGLDLILKDLYSILEKYKLNADTLLNQDQRHVNYYVYTYLEIIFRVNMGVNMDEELKLWRDSLYSEDSIITEPVYKVTRKLVFRFYYIRLKRFLLNNSFIATLIHALGDKLFRNHAQVFNSIEDCLDNIKITQAFK
ncbi:glycosyltransferase [Candidatus Thioglobus sp.]|nr:glycosyltransferase [Candidatus Thioglobus sp.]